MPLHEAWVLGALIMAIGLLVGFNIGIWWARKPRHWRDECPCCSATLELTEDDAPFCWDCGLYERDPASDCDNPEHRGGVMPVEAVATTTTARQIENVPRPESVQELQQPVSAGPGHTIYAELTMLGAQDELDEVLREVPDVDPDWHPAFLARSDAWLAEWRANLGLEEAA